MSGGLMGAAFIGKGLGNVCVPVTRVSWRFVLATQLLIVMPW
jgi:hypothetical protein